MSLEGSRREKGATHGLQTWANGSMTQFPSSAFASCKSFVSNPSVNQWLVGEHSSRRMLLPAQYLSFLHADLPEFDSLAADANDFSHTSCFGLECWETK